MDDITFGALLLYSFAFWLFGLVSGVVYAHARFRFLRAIAEKLSGRDLGELKFLTGENKQALIIGTAVVLSLCAIAAPVYLYHIHSMNLEMEQTKLMIERGYTYVPTRLAGWSKADQVVDNPDFSKTRGDVLRSKDFQPRDALSVQDKLSERTKE